MDVLDPRAVGSVIAALIGILTAIITGRNLRENTRLTNWLQQQHREAEAEKAERLARIAAEESRETRLDKQTWELLAQYRQEVATLRAEMAALRQEHAEQITAIRQEHAEQVAALQAAHDKAMLENRMLTARVAELEHQLQSRPAS